MSMPGISPVPVGGGPPAVASPVPESIPGMSIPGMPPASVGVGELTAVSPEPWSIPDIPDIPAMLDELDLDTIITSPTTAPAMARTTAETTILRVPVMRVIEKTSQDCRIVPVA
jgi:hypothetical protein